MSPDHDLFSKWTAALVPTSKRSRCTCSSVTYKTPPPPILASLETPPILKENTKQFNILRRKKLGLESQVFCKPFFFKDSIFFEALQNTPTPHSHRCFFPKKAAKKLDISYQKIWRRELGVGVSCKVAKVLSSHSASRQTTPFLLDILTGSSLRLSKVA